MWCVDIDYNNNNNNVHFQKHFFHIIQIICIVLVPKLLNRLEGISVYTVVTGVVSGIELHLFFFYIEIVRNDLGNRLR